MLEPGRVVEELALEEGLVPTTLPVLGLVEGRTEDEVPGLVDAPGLTEEPLGLEEAVVEGLEDDGREDVYPGLLLP